LEEEGTVAAPAVSRRPVRPVAVGLAAAALTVAAVSLFGHHGSSKAAALSSPVLEQAAPFKGPDLRDQGGAVTIDFKRPTVLAFFAAWCGPCREELPRLGDTARADHAVDVLGVDVQDVGSEALTLLGQSRADFPVAVDRDSAVSDAYHLRGMPTTFFIAPGGHVVAAHSGPLSARDLRTLLARLEGAR
jgi:thiol-disulfide isomerase/thioredoxin